MSTWLKLLPSELYEIKKYAEPLGEYNSQNDHRAGEMTEDLKKLYTFWQTLEKERDQYLLNARYAEDENKIRLILRKARELNEKADIVGKIFWVSLRDEFELWGKEIVGVRKGFIVVWSEPPQGPRTFFDYLRGL